MNFRTVKCIQEVYLPNYLMVYAPINAKMLSKRYLESAGMGMNVIKIA